MARYVVSFTGRDTRDSDKTFLQGLLHRLFGVTPNIVLGHAMGKQIVEGLNEEEADLLRQQKGIALVQLDSQFDLD